MPVKIYMKMPQDCYRCRFKTLAEDIFICNALKSFKAVDMKADKRPKWCPLKEGKK
jgi:hypothetical protein